VGETPPCIVADACDISVLDVGLNVSVLNIGNMGLDTQHLTWAVDVFDIGLDVSMLDFGLTLASTSPH